MASTWPLNSAKLIIYEGWPAMFQDRIDAGMQLAEKLRMFRGISDTIVFAVPRGGVLVADVVCEELTLPMDIVVTRKLGAPHDEELAIGAVDSKGGTIINQDMIFWLSVSDTYIEIEARSRAKEALDRLKKYRGTDKYESLSGKTAIVVDDGIATGYTVMAAINFLKELNPKKLILATPVIAPDTKIKMEKMVDELIWVLSEEPFYAVGQFYRKFWQVTEPEMMNVLAKRGFPRAKDNIDS